MAPSLRSLWRRLAALRLGGAVLALLALLSFRSAVADWHDVPTGSMQPTILKGYQF